MVAIGQRTSRGGSGSCGGRGVQVYGGSRLQVDGGRGGVVGWCGIRVPYSQNLIFPILSARKQSHWCVSS